LSWRLEPGGDVGVGVHIGDQLVLELGHHLGRDGLGVGDQLRVDLGDCRVADEGGGARQVMAAGGSRREVVDVLELGEREFVRLFKC
jgi:hypothetical protein